MKKIKQLINNLKYLCIVDIEDKLKPPTIYVKDIRESKRIIKNHGDPNFRRTK